MTSPRGMRSKNSNPGLSDPTPAVFPQEASRPQSSVWVKGIWSAWVSSCPRPPPPPPAHSRAEWPSPDVQVELQSTNVDRSSHFTRNVRPLRRKLISGQPALVHDNVTQSAVLR